MGPNPVSSVSFLSFTKKVPHHQVLKAIPPQPWSKGKCPSSHSQGLRGVEVVGRDPALPRIPGHSYPWMWTGLLPRANPEAAWDSKACRSSQRCSRPVAPGRVSHPSLLWVRPACASARQPQKKGECAAESGQILRQRTLPSLASLLPTAGQPFPASGLGHGCCSVLSFPTAAHSSLPRPPLKGPVLRERGPAWPPWGAAPPTYTLLLLSLLPSCNSSQFIIILCFFFFVHCQPPPREQAPRKRVCFGHHCNLSSCK